MSKENHPAGSEALDAFFSTAYTQLDQKMDTLAQKGKQTHQVAASLLSSKSWESSHQALMVCLAEYGSVVFQRNVERPSRSLVIVKDMHGDINMTQDALMHPEYARLYFEHQGCLNEALHAIKKQHDKPELFVESFPRGQEHLMIDLMKELSPPNIIAQTHEGVSYFRKDKRAAQQFFALLQEHINAGNSSQASITLQRFGGYDRFMAETLENEQWKGHVHGMMDEDRQQIMSRAAEGWNDPNMFYALSVQDHRQTHEKLTRDIESYLLPGAVGVAMLGGTHTRSGTISDLAMKGLYQVTRPYLLEEYLEKSTALNDANIAVFEPHKYAELVNYPGL